jgi:hypothetical protein
MYDRAIDSKKDANVSDANGGRQDSWNKCFGIPLMYPEVVPSGRFDNTYSMGSSGYERIEPVPPIPAPVPPAPPPAPPAPPAPDGECTWKKYQNENRYPAPHCPPGSSSSAGAGRCHEGTLEAAQLKCIADPGCSGVVLDNAGYEPRDGSAGVGPYPTRGTMTWEKVGCATPAPFTPVPPPPPPPPAPDFTPIASNPNTVVIPPNPGTGPVYCMAEVGVSSERNVWKSGRILTEHEMYKYRPRNESEIQSMKGGFMRTGAGLAGAGLPNYSTMPTDSHLWEADSPPPGNGVFWIWSRPDGYKGIENEILPTFYYNFNNPGPDIFAKAVGYISSLHYGSIFKLNGKKINFTVGNLLYIPSGQNTIEIQIVDKLQYNSYSRTWVFDRRYKGLRYGIWLTMTDIKSGSIIVKTNCEGWRCIQKCSTGDSCYYVHTRQNTYAPWNRNDISLAFVPSSNNVTSPPPPPIQIPSQLTDGTASNKKWTSTQFNKLDYKVDYKAENRNVPLYMETYHAYGWDVERPRTVNFYCIIESEDKKDYILFTNILDSKDPKSIQGEGGIFVRKPSERPKFILISFPSYVTGATGRWAFSHYYNKYFGVLFSPEIKVPHLKLTCIQVL